VAATVSSQLRHGRDIERGVKWIKRERTVTPILIATPPTDGVTKGVTVRQRLQPTRLAAACDANHRGATAVSSVHRELAARLF